MTQKMQQRVPQFPNHRTVLDEPLKLELVVFFAYVADAYDAGLVHYAKIAEYLIAKFGKRHDLALSVSPRRYIGKQIADLQSYLHCDDLTHQSRSTGGLTDIGDVVGQWARGIRACIDGNAREHVVIPAPNRLTIATHHYYEWVALPNVIERLVGEPTGRAWKIRVRQVDNVFQGIDLLRDGLVDALIDGVPKDAKFPGPKPKDLGLTFKRVVLVPHSEKHNFIQREGRMISVNDIVDKPIAFVDMPKELETRLGSGQPTASRIRLSTTASVVKMVRDHGFYGLALNWRALWQESLSHKPSPRRVKADFDRDPFDVRFLDDNLFPDDVWRLFYRHETIAGSRTQAKPNKVVQLLCDHLRAFAETQKDNFVLP